MRRLRGQTYTFDRIGLNGKKKTGIDRCSGKKLRKVGNRFGVSESGVTQASRGIRIRQKNDKKFGKLIAKMMRELNLSNV